MKKSGEYFIVRNAISKTYNHNNWYYNSLASLEDPLDENKLVNDYIKIKIEKSEGEYINVFINKNINDNQFYFKIIPGVVSKFQYQLYLKNSVNDINVGYFNVYDEKTQKYIEKILIETFGENIIIKKEKQ